MIVNVEVEHPTLGSLAWQGLKRWETHAVLGLLSDEDPLVRTLAGRELQLRGGEDVFRRVLAHCQAPDEALREVCAFVLGQLGTPERPFAGESFPVLVRLLDDEDVEVRATSAAALGHLVVGEMPDVVLHRLLEAAEDEQAGVRSAVAVSLGGAPNLEAVSDALAKLCTDPVVDVRESAELSIELLRSR